MATYFYGASGECADCSNDDPCAPALTSIELFSTSYVDVDFERLRDLDTTGDQLFIVRSPANAAKILKWDGSSYSVGAELTISTTGGYRFTRTSHDGYTFALLDNFRRIRLYSIDPTTLAITETLSDSTMATELTQDMVFIDDDELMRVRVLRTSSIIRELSFTKITITGGGTGISVSSSVEQTYTDPSSSTSDHVRMEKVEDGKIACLYKLNLNPRPLGIVFVDGTGATPSIGSDVAGGWAPPSNQVVTSDDSENGGIFTYTRNLNRYRTNFCVYGTVGADVDITSSSVPAASLNSDTVGVYFDGRLFAASSQDVSPMTISGTTITVGTPVNTTGGEIRRIKGNNVTTSTLIRGDGSSTTAELIT